MITYHVNSMCISLSIEKKKCHQAEIIRSNRSWDEHRAKPELNLSASGVPGNPGMKYGNKS